MIDIAQGRYWDLPLSLVSGCTPCSPGCRGCWSAGLAHRFGEYTIKCGNEPPRFMGVVKTHPDRLAIPLRRRKPTVWAVWNDLFHEAVPVNFLEGALAVMTQCPQHTFLVLTKRARRLNLMTDDRLRVSRTDTWPIKNLWLGITVCNQAEADAKIPEFLKVPGKKFLSIEPCLGQVTLEDYSPALGKHYLNRDYLRESISPFTEKIVKDRIDAVILGGETGPGARPLHPVWVRSVRDQCAAAGVPFFFKQWGEWVSMNTVHTLPYFNRYLKSQHSLSLDGSFTPEFWEGCVSMYRVGRKAAGRILDGRTHNELPWVK